MKDNCTEQKIVTKMAGINSTTSKIISHVNGLNTLVKNRDCQSEFKKQQTPNYTLSIRIHFKYKGSDRLKVKGWRKKYCANTNEKKAGLPILISDKADFTTRKIIKNKELNHIIIEGSILQDDLKILNRYAPKNRAKTDRSQNYNGIYITST